MANVGVQALDLPMTLDAWAALDEDTAGELVNGRLVEEEVASYLHELVVAWLVRILGNALVARGGRVTGSELKLAVSATRGRKADVAVFLPDAKQPSRNAGIVRIPPSVLVEVVSSDARDVRRDRVEKLREYAVFGVKVYVLVDPVARVFEFFELGSDGRYVLALSATEGTHALPGSEDVILPLDQLWAEIDSLPDDER